MRAMEGGGQNGHYALIIIQNIFVLIFVQVTGATAFFAPSIDFASHPT